MKEAAYFRQCDEIGRSDKYEGGIVFPPSDYLLSVNGVDIEFENVLLKFDRYSKVLIFCCSILEQGINCEISMINGNKTKIEFNRQFIEEISKFGKYMVVFDLFIKEAKKYAKNNNCMFHHGKIKYVTSYDKIAVKKKNDLIHANKYFDLYFYKDSILEINMSTDLFLITMRII